MSVASRPLGTILRLGGGLVAVRPAGAALGDLLRPGRLLAIGEEARAAVMCARGGLFLAALLPSSPGAPPPPVSEGAEASVMLDEALHVPIGGSPLGARILDHLGHPLDGGVPLTAAREAFAAAPTQAQLQPIHRSLHTGTVAIDALTPIGRGQTMLLLGENGVGKSSVAWDAILAQEDTDVSCVLALTDGGSERAAAALEQLRGSGAHSLLARTTIVAPRRDSVASRVLALSTAVAIGEDVRSSGGHALVVADELRGICELWDAAGEAVRGAGVAHTPAAATQQSAEQRILYASMLQRAGQLDVSCGGGSLTLLGSLRTPPPPTARVGDAASAAHSPASYSIDDFERHPREQRSRVEALLSRGIRVDALALERIGIAPPEPTTGAAAGADTAEADATRAQGMHVDQLMSLADGHVQLETALFNAGRRPAVRPVGSLGRVGAGSDVSKRPQPTTPAMQRVASNLRLELAQAHDLRAADAADAAIRAQRMRAAAVEAVMCGQPCGSPLRLSEQLVVLHALVGGHLDHLASATAGRAADTVRELLTHVRGRAGDLMDSADETGELSEEARRELLRAVSELHGGGGARAFFGTYDASTWAPGRGDR